ncbi:MAG: site-specific DNA-methyltransferase [Christensenellales bacterium]
MNKLRMESPDMTAQNIDRIAALFPNCITEMLDEERSTPEKKVYKRAINFEMLKQMLSPDVVDGDEAYEFTWVGKKAAIVEANKPIRKTLRPCVEESKDWDSTENLYIEGDNLEVLKLLQESYLGKVKMIYIDPPYNTGNDFIYADDFKMESEEWKVESGEWSEEGDRLFKNTDTNGRFHSDWCSMIYSRLMLARNLLTEDGVIFISIDDNELSSLIDIGKEIFGFDNYVATFVWEKRKTRENRKIVSVRHDYIICFTKTFEQRSNAIGLEEMNDEAIDRYKNPDNDPRGVWTSVPAIAQGGHATKSQFYTLISPKGLSFNPPSGSCWRYTQERMQQAIEDNRIWFGSDGTGVPRIKKFLSEGKQGLTPETLLVAENAGTNDSAKRELVSLFDGIAVFETPKPVSLIMHILSICNNAKEGICLDFFSGTSTTAHAVMQLNAEDGGHRRFIMVQLPEKCDEKSEAYKAGYKTICEIGKERIRRAGEKILKEQLANNNSTLNSPNSKLDIGFRVLKLDDTNMKDVYYAPDDYDQGMLAGLKSNIKDDRTDLDLLFGCLIDWGRPLSLPYKSEQIDGCTVHTYNDGDLIACFDANVPESVVKEIAQRRPLRAVFRDSGFASSPEKINMFEIFKLYMPEDAGDITKRVRVI